jgi:RNA polymerase sigma-70 factor (ECF subfamily)
VAPATWTLDGSLPAAWSVTVARDERVATGERLDDLSEAALVDLALSGRTDAFDVIVTRHRRPVYLLCYRFVGTHEDASDLAQDVFVRAFRGLRGFRGRSSLGTWLYRIAVNVSLNRVNAKSLVTEDLDVRQHVDVRSESPAERLLKRERAAQVRAAISRLPRKQRATLILRMYHDLSHQEIAGILGSSVGAVKANFFHALNALRRQLGPRGR